MTSKSHHCCYIERCSFCAAMHYYIRITHSALSSIICENKFWLLWIKLLWTRLFLKYNAYTVLLLLARKKATQPWDIADSKLLRFSPQIVASVYTHIRTIQALQLFNIFTSTWCYHVLTWSKHRVVCRELQGLVRMLQDSKTCGLCFFKRQNCSWNVISGSSQV